MPPTPWSRLPLSRSPAARPRVARTGSRQSLLTHTALNSSPATRTRSLRSPTDASLIDASLSYEQGSLTDAELGSSRTIREQLGEDSGWLITLSDLTLLFLCFFVIWHVVDKRQTTDHRPQTAGALAAVSRQPSAVRIRTGPSTELRTSLTEPFPSVPLPKLSEVVPALSPVFLTEPSVALAAPPPSLPRPVSDSPILRFGRGEPGKGGIGEAAAATADTTGEESATPPADRWDALRDEMERYVAETGLGEGIGVVSTQHELLVSLKDTVPFASGRADLREEVFPVLEKVAALTQNHPDLTLEVLGHTDDVPISTPEFPSNWELSAARASRVARYLIEKGVDPTRISTQGYAHFRPLLPNTRAENRAVNRRVEIRLYRTMDRELSENRQRFETETGRRG